MRSRQRRTRTIERVDQLQAMASPVRHRIVAALETSGPATAKELAALLGTVPESIYYHLDQLIDVDLIFIAGSESTARRPAKLYDLAARDWEVRLDEASAGYRAAYGEMGGALLRWADRSHRAALQDPAVRQSGPQRERSLAQFHARLSPAGLEKVNGLLEELESTLADHEDPSGEAYAITCVVVPI